MAITMTTMLAHSQGRVWQGISLMEDTKRRMLTRIMTVEMEKRQMSRLEMMLPSLTPPMSRDEVLRYLDIKINILQLNLVSCNVYVSILLMENIFLFLESDRAHSGNLLI